jgi:rhamnose transport system permease protein
MTPESVAPASHPSRTRAATGLSLRDLGAVIALGLVGLVLLVVAPRFFDPANLRDLAVANAPALIIAAGVTIVLITGHVDISVGSGFAVCSVVFGVLARDGLPPLAAAVPAIACGAALGAVNGSLVASLGLPSVVVTLATMVIWREGLRWWTQGAWVQGLPASFQWFGLPQPAGEALVVIAALGGVAVGAYVLQSVAIGRALYAVGSDPESARLNGLRPSRIVFGGFVVLGAATGLAAVLNAVRFTAVQANAGIGLELQVLAAAVVGGTLITGGRGTLVGTLGGAALLAVLGPALTYLGINPFWEKAVQGGIILVAAAVDASVGRGATKKSTVDSGQ